MGFHAGAWEPCKNQHQKSVNQKWWVEIQFFRKKSPSIPDYNDYQDFRRYHDKRPVNWCHKLFCFQNVLNPLYSD